MRSAFPLLFDYETDEQFFKCWREDERLSELDPEEILVSMNFRYAMKQVPCPECKEGIWAYDIEELYGPKIYSPYDDTILQSMKLLVHCMCPSEHTIYEVINLGEKRKPLHSNAL